MAPAAGSSIISSVSLSLLSISFWISSIYLSVSFCIREGAFDSSSDISSLLFQLLYRVVTVAAHVSYRHAVFLGFLLCLLHVFLPALLSSRSGIWILMRLPSLEGFRKPSDLSIAFSTSPRFPLSQG